MRGDRQRAEEHSIIGGLGSAVAEVLAGPHSNAKFSRVGIRGQVRLLSGKPADLFAEFGLTPARYRGRVRDRIRG